MDSLIADITSISSYVHMDGIGIINIDPWNSYIISVSLNDVGHICRYIEFVNQDLN